MRKNTGFLVGGKQINLTSSRVVEGREKAEKKYQFPIYIRFYRGCVGFGDLTPPLYDPRFVVLDPPRVIGGVI